MIQFEVDLIQPRDKKQSLFYIFFTLLLLYFLFHLQKPVWCGLTERLSQQVFPENIFHKELNVGLQNES